MDDTCKLCILIISNIIALIICITHFVYSFFIEGEAEFNTIFNNLDSSPLFNFRISDNCDSDSHIIFHVWKGLKESYINGNLERDTRYYGQTDIVKLNGKMFCYKKISYKELLKSGQIIKNEENCGEKYPIDCGTIDTLEQKLCINNSYSCP